MFRSRAAARKNDENDSDQPSKPFTDIRAGSRVTGEPSPTSEVGSIDIETQGVEVPEGFSPISADTPVNIIFEGAQKLTKSALARQNEAMDLGEETEFLQLCAYSVSPISSQIPPLGWCCDHFGTITSIVCCLAAFVGGAAMLKFLDDTQTAVLLVAGFLIFMGCVLFVWSIREILVLYAKKKFLREQQQRQLSRAASQASGRQTIPLPHTVAVQASTSRRVQETELGPSASKPAELQSVEEASKPSTSGRHEEKEVGSTPETTSESPESLEKDFDKPQSPRGKYPPKGDYTKGQRTGYYLETDI